MSRMEQNHSSGRDIAPGSVCLIDIANGRPPPDSYSSYVAYCAGSGTDVVGSKAVSRASCCRGAKGFDPLANNIQFFRHESMLSSSSDAAAIHMRFAGRSITRMLLPTH